MRHEVMEPVELTRTTLDSPLGTLTLVERGGVLCGLCFEDRLDGLEPWLMRRFPAARWSRPPAPTPSAKALRSYFAGELRALEALEVDPGGSAFQGEVWRALRRIDVGATRSYADLAAELGKPGAVRAVARANAANPVAIVIPCHRVIGSDGSLTGYGGGLERKRWLLRHEAAAATFRLRSPGA
jgi:methylated-DNA-[protein]-cysteine S-methyltransferase